MTPTHLDDERPLWHALLAVALLHIVPAAMLVQAQDRGSAWGKFWMLLQCV